MVSAKEVILNYICPAGGVILANLMFGAPIRALLARIPKGSLGPLNPTPWAFMTGNCVGWLGYSFLRHDIPLLLGNAPGFLVSVWLNLNAAKLIFQSHARSRIRESLPMLISRTHSMSVRAASRASLAFLLERKNTSFFEEDEEGEEDENKGEEERNASESAPDLDDSHSSAPPGLQVLWEQTLDLITLEKAPVAHEYMVVGILFVWLAIFSTLAFIQNLSNDTRVFVIGIIVNCNLLFFYGGPLSTMFRVMKSRDSSSIHRWTMIMNTVNSSFWTAYGFGIMDWFVFVPNGIGVIFGAIQIFLCILFPVRVSGPSVDVTKMGDDDLMQLEESNISATKSEVPASMTFKRKCSHKVSFAIDKDICKTASDDISCDIEASGQGTGQGTIGEDQEL